MNDPTVQGESSNSNDLGALIRKFRDEFLLANPNDTRWPCPFCFHKSATIVQCHIHVSKDHPNLYKVGTANHRNSLQSKAKISTESYSQQPTDDLDEFLRLIKNDRTRSTDTIVCKRCTNKVKECKGYNGLKVHYSRVHKEFMSDSMTQRTNASTSSTFSNAEVPVNENHGQEDKNLFCCRVTTCSKSFASQNGLKIHMAKCHKESPIDCNESNFVELIQSYKAGVKVIRRIPRGARISVATKLASLMNECVSINSVKAWESLFLFPYHVLNVRRTNSKQKSLTKTIKENAIKTVYDVKPETRISVSLKNIIESKVADGDVRGAIRILSSADSIATENDATFEILQEKHPLPSNTTDKPNPPNGILPLIVTEKQVEDRISTFAAGSASGIDGLSPQHLRDLLAVNCGGAASKLLTAITNLSNLMLSGKVCPEFAPFLFGASLIAFNKKDGGIRPIAIGSTIRRLV